MTIRVELPGFLAMTAICLYRRGPGIFREDYLVIKGPDLFIGTNKEEWTSDVPINESEQVTD